jgi:aminoglycoside 3-N-acetyltransferase
MSKEYDIVKLSNRVHTKKSLIKDFKNMGINEGMTIIVHSSLSSIGWVCGGPIAVIDALIEVIGEYGNIVMPSHSGDYSEPSYWCAPPVPKEWHQVIRDEMPAFDPKTTPCRGRGIIAETFMKYKGVKRSHHPQVSFSAYGKDKNFITDNHSLEYGLSENSPIGRLYDLNAYVLLLGVPYDNNTSFHLSEYRSECRDEFISGAPISENGKRIWKEFCDLELDSDGFGYIGELFEKEHNVINYKIGNASCKLFSQRECVNFATDFLSCKR